MISEVKLSEGEVGLRSAKCGEGKGIKAECYVKCI